LSAEKCLLREMAHNCSAQNAQAQKSKIDAFVAKWSRSGHPIAVVTSGGTTVPLERNTVRFVDNFSTGTRGSLVAEYLLAHGYAVLYVHRDTAARPFMRALSPAVSDVHAWEVAAGASSAAVPLTHEQSTAAAARQAALKSGLYEEVTFNSVSDYLHMLRLASTALQTAGLAGMMVMAAAVSDFYLPEGKISEHKIQSKGGDTNLELDLFPVPKLLGYVTQLWGPSNFNVSFKLETDERLLVSKATRAAQAYGVDAVVANMLQTRCVCVAVCSVAPPRPCFDPPSVVSVRHFQSPQPFLYCRAEKVDVFAADSQACESYTRSQVLKPAGGGVVEAGLVAQLVRLHAKHRGLA
jgi:phosphopantothenate-cysteine ligase